MNTRKLIKRHKLVIRPDATMVCLYDDAIRPLIDQAAEASITRISNVHTTTDAIPQFYARLIDGPTSPSFPLRSQAIAWEVDWANEHLVK